MSKIEERSNTARNIVKALLFCIFYLLGELEYHFMGVARIPFTLTNWYKFRMVNNDKDSCIQLSSPKGAVACLFTISEMLIGML